MTALSAGRTPSPALLQSGGRRKESPGVRAGVAAVIFFVFVANAWRIATDPSLWGPDNVVYAANYSAIEQCNCVLATSRHSLELLWPAMQFVAMRVGVTFSLFFGLVVLLQLTLWLLVSMRLQKSLESIGINKSVFMLAATTFIVIWPFITSGLVNVLRSGIAIPTMILALMFAADKRWIAGSVLAVAAVGIQQPVALALLVGGLIGLVIPRRWALLLLALGTLIYISDLGGRLFALVGLDYVGAEIQLSRIESVGIYDSGVRLDFLASALILVAVLLLAENLTRNYPLPKRIVEISIGLTLPFMFLGTTAFADRLLQGPWNFIPLVILAVTCTSRKLIPGIALSAVFGLALWTAVTYLN